jgi:hypothetical protein
MRKAGISDKSIILDILTRSFDDNKSVNYVVKQDQNRVDRITKLMDYSFNVCNEFGEVWISDDQQACALILFPDKKRSSFIVKVSNTLIGSFGNRLLRNRPFSPQSLTGKVSKLLMSKYFGVNFFRDDGEGDF